MCSFLHSLVEGDGSREGFRRSKVNDGRQLRRETGEVGVESWHILDDDFVYSVEFVEGCDFSVELGVGEGE